MANDVNIKFAVDGEKQFKSAISAIKSEVKEADSALKLASEQMKGMTDEEEKARVKTEALQKVYDANKKALETLAAQQEKQRQQWRTLPTQWRRQRKPEMLRLSQDFRRSMTKQRKVSQIWEPR